MSAHAEAPPQPIRAPAGKSLPMCVSYSQRLQELRVSTAQSSKVVLTHELLELCLQSVIIIIAPTGNKSHTELLV